MRQNKNVFVKGNIPFHKNIYIQIGIRCSQWWNIKTKGQILKYEYYSCYKLKNVPNLLRENKETSSVLNGRTVDFVTRRVKKK
jgi:DNA polymerase elongation subunit (family B)